MSVGSRLRLGIKSLIHTTILSPDSGGRSAAGSGPANSGAFTPRGTAPLYDVGFLSFTWHSIKEAMLLRRKGQKPLLPCLGKTTREMVARTTRKPPVCFCPGIFLAALRWSGAEPGLETSGMEKWYSFSERYRDFDQRTLLAQHSDSSSRKYIVLLRQHLNDLPQALYLIHNPVDDRLFLLGAVHCRNPFCIALLSL